VLRTQFLDGEGLVLLVVGDVLLVIVGLVLVTTELLEVDLKHSGRVVVQHLLLGAVVDDDILDFSVRILCLDAASEQSAA